MKEKTPLSHEVVCFQMLDFETSIWGLKIKFMENDFFLKNDLHGYFRGSCFSQYF